MTGRIKSEPKISLNITEQEGVALSKFLISAGLAGAAFGGYLADAFGIEDKKAFVGGFGVAAMILATIAIKVPKQ